MTWQAGDRQVGSHTEDWHSPRLLLLGMYLFRELTLPALDACDTAAGPDLAAEGGTQQYLSLKGLQNYVQALEAISARELTLPRLQERSQNWADCGD